MSTARAPDSTSRGNDLFRVLAKAIFLAAGLLVLLWFLHAITGVLLFFMLAVVLAVTLNAPVTWLEERGIRRGLATLLLAVTLLGGLVLLGWLIVPRLVREATTLIQSLPEVVAKLASRISSMLVAYPEIERQVRIDERLGSQLVPWVLGALGDISRYSFTLVALLLLFLVLISIVMYMVADPRPLLEAYVRATPPHLRSRATRAFARASQTTVGWMSANLILGTMKAVPVFLFLHLLEIPGALLWSVLAFFSQIVPRLGFYVMAIPPVVVALSVAPSRAGWIALFFWVLSEFLGNFVAPRVQASTMDLHAVFLLFVMLAMGAAFGILGVLIATPVAGFIRAYYEEFYLADQPNDPRLQERVDAMLRRQGEPEDLRPV